MTAPFRVYVVGLPKTGTSSMAGVARARGGVDVDLKTLPLDKIAERAAPDEDGFRARPYEPPGCVTDWRTTETEEYFTWRGQKLPMRNNIRVGRMTPIQPLSERATAGREKMIEATLQMWADGGGAMTRQFAERYVDGLAAEVGSLMAMLNAVADGWETRGDRRGMARKDLRRFIDKVLEDES